jgi:hypothetical protein
MLIRFAAILIAVALQAEDAPKPNPEQEIAELKAEIRIYQQNLGQCLGVQIHEQAQKQAQKAK